MITSKVFINLSTVSRLLNSRWLLTQQVRNIPRWAHRRPIKVMFADSNACNHSIEKLKAERNVVNTALQEKSQTDTLKSQIELDRDSNDTDAFNVQRSVDAVESSQLDKPYSSNKYERKQVNHTMNKSKRERKFDLKTSLKTKRLEESASEAGVPVYSKLKDNDAKFSKLMSVAKSKNKKSTRSCIVLEGKLLIKDAIQAGYIPEHVFFSRVKDAADLKLPPNGVGLYKISYKTIELWSDLTTSPGVVAFLRTPDIKNRKPEKDALPLTIVCDKVRDPGNLGSILRGAAGVGCEKVILTKGCVDLWEPKVLRSGAGAHFRTSIVNNLDWKDVHEHFDSDARVFLADSSLSQIHVKEEGSPASYEIIPVLPYFAVDYFNCGPIVLVVGGETEGLSTESFRLACDRKGVRLNIPLSNKLDSLNAGIALGIIMFEIRRQFLMSRIENLDNCTSYSS